jgi:uracil-DNA glycosylase
MDCVECKSYPIVQFVSNAKAWNGCRLPDPRDILDFGRRRVLFISEAPPGGVNRTFFYNGMMSDRLRDYLFEAIRLSGLKVANLKDFNDLNCYLLPSFPFPCGQNSNGDSNGENAHPSPAMVEHAATEHTRLAVEYIDPTSIVLLGERATWAARAIPKPCFVTFWPTKRRENYRQHWLNHLAPTLRAALTDGAQLTLKPLATRTAL